MQQVNAMFSSFTLSIDAEKRVASSDSIFALISRLLFSILVILTIVQAQEQTTLIIDACAAPTDNSSLQYYLCGEGTKKLVPNTTLQLSEGIHTLEEGPFCLLQNLQNFTIRGHDTHPRTVIYCNDETEARTGIAFFNISNLHLSHIDFVNCGVEVPSKLPGDVNDTFAYLGPLQKAVILITHSTYVTVKNISILRCLGFGLLFINPLEKTIIDKVLVAGTTSKTLRNCTEPLVRSDMLCGGSGVAVVFSDTNITEHLVEASENYTTSLSITNSFFVNNTNWVPTRLFLDLYNIIVEAYDTERILMTGGISLIVYIGQKSYFVDVRISDTSILSNIGNMANFVMLHYNTIHMSTAHIEGVTVNGNQVRGTFESRGAGLMILVMIFFDTLNTFPELKADIYDLVEIHQSNFSHNLAYSGGGIMLYISPQNVSNVRLVVRETKFTGNVAAIGPALYVYNSPSLVDYRGAYIYLEDVVASGNTFIGANTLDTPPDNTGVFLVGFCFNLTLVGTEEKGSLFNSNQVSVFLAVRTNIVLHGQIIFEDNRGYRGGALNLVENSVLFIHNRSNIIFMRNKAFREGGAIYINTLGSSVSFTCSIQILAERRVKISYEELQLLNLSIVFSKNNALVAGNSIFARNLYYCLFLPTSSIANINRNYLNHVVLYRVLFDFQQTAGNELSELNSVEQIICICPNTTFARENCAQFHHLLGHQVIPGSTFDLFLNSVDAVGTPVASLLYSFPRSANTSNHVQLDVNQDVRPIPGRIQCSPVNFRIFAPENITLFLDLSATIGGRKLTIEISTMPCPPGFTLGSTVSNSRLSCLCSEFIQMELKSTCNLTKHTIARPTNFWVGTKDFDRDKQIIQFVSTCPINYCKKGVTDIDLRVADTLCVDGRTGTLCGACREGLSSVFGTADCRKFSNAWLAILPVFGLIGAVMVIFSFLLDITITHGLINGIFFYSNIVMVNANIFFQGSQSGFLFWFLSWFNLDIGFPLCFYDGMTESAKLGLQYVFPTYIILMIAFIILISQHSLRMQRILSQLNGIHVLVSMFYISFLKLFRTAIDTITFVTIVTESKADSIVWFFDGTQAVNDPTSVFFVVLGCLTLVCFILPYVVFFTFSTYIQQCVNSTRLNAFVDASLAPYKNNKRFWFGVRLILTSIIYIIIANRGTNNPTFTLTLEISFLVGYALIQTYICPFKSLGVALLDLSFLVNLIALTVGTSYTIQSDNRYPDQDILINLSISVALLTNMGIILWHIVRKLYRNKVIRERVFGLVNMLVQALKLNKTKGIVEIMTKIKKEGGASEGAVPPDEGEYLSGCSDPPTQTTTITLQDMLPAADDNQEEQMPPSPQLREPVLEFVNK